MLSGSAPPNAGNQFSKKVASLYRMIQEKERFTGNTTGDFDHKYVVFENKCLMAGIIEDHEGATVSAD